MIQTLTTSLAVCVALKHNPTPDVPHTYIHILRFKLKRQVRIIKEESGKVRGRERAMERKRQWKKSDCGAECKRRGVNR